jgi:ABC-type phosphate transport system substrate-binding protein
VLAEGGAPHKALLQEYMGKSDQALRTYLKSLVFTGKGSMPKSFGSDAEIVKYVASTKGAIGYVSPASDAAGVKKLQVQ